MFVLTREQLYELVWSEPMRLLGPKFGLSDVGLKKVCQRLDVPPPPRGYWAKRQAGKNAARVRLPLRGPGMPHTWSYGPTPPWRWPPDPVAELAALPPELPVFPEPIADVEARVRKALGRVPARPLTGPHPAIRELLEKDEKLLRKQQEHVWAFGYYQPRFTSGFERRRLRLLNSLFLGVAKLGVKGWTGGDAARRLGVTVGVQQVTFRLDHPAAKPNRDGEWSVRTGPADTLCLDIESLDDPELRSSWRDSGHSQLEQQLPQIAVGLIVAGEALYRRTQVGEYRRAMQRRAEMEAELQRRRAEQERVERERKEQEAQRRRDALRSQAREWREAADLRAFIDAVENRGPINAAMRAWLDWARIEADALDPFANGSAPKFASELPEGRSG